MRRTPATVTVGLAATAVTAALVLAGCSSSGGGSGTSSGAASAPPSAPGTTDVTVTVTHHPSSSSAPSSSAPAGSSGVPSSSPAAPSGACGNRDLQIASSEGNGATGHNRYVLYFQNVSSRTCTLHGYPGLDALAASGSELAHAKRAPFGFMGGSRKGLPTVHVKPGSYASAVVEWETLQPGTGDACDVQAVKIAVTAANTTRAVVLDRPVTTCTLQIHPTVPGRTGDLT